MSDTSINADNLWTDITIFAPIAANAYLRGGNPFPRYPKKRELQQFMRRWTQELPGEQYFYVQAARRRLYPEGTVPALPVLQMNRGMQMYMNKFAPRAPSMPARVSRNKVTRLYRGALATRKQLQDLLASGVWNDKGYMAFSRRSRDKYHVHTPAKPVTIVFRMPVSAVQPGTPWVWFDVENKPTRRSNSLTSFVKGEEEVLLPPGALFVERVTPSPVNKAIYECDVAAYVPADYPERRPKPLKTADAAHPFPLYSFFTTNGGYSGKRRQGDEAPARANKRKTPRR